MTVLTAKTKLAHTLSIETRGKYGIPSSCGEFLIGDSVLGEEDSRQGIFQVRNRYGRRVHVRQMYVVPPYSSSAAIVASRAKFADAVAAWQLLSPAVKAYYKLKVRGKNLHPHNLFIKLYMLSS
jgi:hypothetical protein